VARNPARVFSRKQRPYRCRGVADADFVLRRLAIDAEDVVQARIA